jgi:hydrogenase maturation factor
MRRIRFIDAFSAGSRQDSRPVVHVLRDRTRSGVTSVLIEIAQTAKVGLLLDPLYAANEGKLLVIIAIENRRSCAQSPEFAFVRPDKLVDSFRILIQFA